MSLLSFGIHCMMTNLELFNTKTSAMENRASPNNEQTANKPSIIRRSCDQCRMRKIRCDGGTPCSNCRSARVDCNYSRIAPRTSAVRQRIQVSENYGEKIDAISRDVSDIKSLLAGLGVSRTAAIPSLEEHRPAPAPQKKGDEHPRGQDVPRSIPLRQWDHSSHIITFIKSVVQEGTSAYPNSEWDDTITSLKSLVDALENPQSARKLASPELTVNILEGTPSVPNLEAVLGILRWAKEHSSDFRISWICRFLPLDKFLDICTKVWFGVGEPSLPEKIIANSFIAYVSAEYSVVHGDIRYRSYCQHHRSLVEVVTAMTLGSLYMVEEGRVSHAWILISNAMTACQTLGYHRADRYSGGDKDMQTQLFWAVYTYENSLSLRLGRCSGIRDSDITLPIERNQHRAIRLGRIQGKVYNQLYSPEGLASADDVRGEAAEGLAQQVQAIIDESQADVAVALSRNTGIDEDPARVIYLHCDLVCQSSLMGMILKAIPSSTDTGAMDRCVTVARNTLDLHEQCMKLVNGCKDPLLIKRYISWAILHTPFFPFSIVFENAIRHANADDLDRLDRFSASFMSDSVDNEGATHPYRLYELLSQAARLCVQLSPTSAHSSSTAPSSGDMTMEDLGINNLSDGRAGDVMLDRGRDELFSIGDWFQGNQQFLQLLHEDISY
ncbi:uncharacterized protein B0J16DRAFT_418161 [Fusarium flagelliforme]|uniref:uncharacterized protein n=1 Tax=Fusarium flagelliforme TaxID=2675880 RepID=UPI001E8CCFEE|nr:uncharacterized protein B0J16DRAFT_418161 [Fusarium flagelliforme]KAH7174712.1 hypothetical protein B0J16DRAFT_418161 [Fusarium flagelliforme]